MVSQFCFLLFLAVLVCGGLSVASQPKGFLHKRKVWMEQLCERRPGHNYWCKPVLTCYACTASLWGSMTYLGIAYALHWLSRDLLILWPVAVFGTALINGLLGMVFSVCQAYLTYAHDQRVAFFHHRTGKWPDSNG